MLSKSTDTFYIELLKDILIKYEVPKKYFHYEQLDVDCSCKLMNVDRLSIHLNIFSVNTIVIPYLENQSELKRIIFTKEEGAVIKAIKELLKVKDDTVTFDSYIDSWAKRLLRGE